MIYDQINWGVLLGWFIPLGVFTFLYCRTKRELWLWQMIVNIIIQVSMGIAGMILW